MLLSTCAALLVREVRIKLLHPFLRFTQYAYRLCNRPGLQRLRGEVNVLESRVRVQIKVRPFSKAVSLEVSNTRVCKNGFMTGRGKLLRVGALQSAVSSRALNLRAYSPA